MKITFLLPHVKISGGVKTLLEYANLLNDKGHTVRLVIPQEKSKWYRLDRKLKNRANGIVTANPESIDWFTNRIAVHTVPALHPRYVPPADILIASSWETAYAAEEFPPEKGSKFYFIQHHEALWTKHKEQARRTYRMPFHKIVISRWLQDILTETYHQQANVLVTPVNRDLFFCDDKPWNQPPRVCLLHHDYDWKGYADAIMAVKKVLSRNNDLKVTVFGAKLKNADALRRAAGLEFDYHYRPTGELLRRIYTECDIYLCASWHEGLGMPAMEAMACRAALVTTDTGGCRDYALHNQTALLSQPRNVDQLADNLAAVVADRDLLRRLSESGHQKIQDFDWQENCAQLIRLFEDKL